MDPVIDAVVTWVDGSDPVHAARRRAALATEGRAAPRAGAETRFADRGEIYWCLASLLRFAPFLRRIHLVTDAQRPEHLDAFARAGLCAPDRIRVVDHREVFAGHEAALPTFSSRSIEAAIGRVPGLADYALYLNDDFFLAAPAEPGQFVSPDGRVILHGRMRDARWPRLKARLRRGLSRGRAADPGFGAAQARAAAEVGMGRYLSLGHHPHILRRDTMAAAFDESRLARQIAHRFRHADQLLPVALANQLELRAGRAIVRPPADVAYVRPGRPDEARAALDRLDAKTARFGCIQSLDEIAAADPSLARRIGVSLDRLLGEALPPVIRSSQAPEGLAEASSDRVPDGNGTSTERHTG